ncbi:hypothetical protein BOX15_Mlig017733g3 [Macrostomum lignano]|uniref:Uncharacterized protein n=2 Tax=Macrostomum lignano TaxID=282301 RepID=A0A267FM54_9PLAT|nr:hypothetical protein BOX15_Mlig017733g4 [Macrostomum lignano]PAA82260.1 hypothetical protein BOX15_Mlig017733g3 [Macrostomum lignano]
MPVDCGSKLQSFGSKLLRKKSLAEARSLETPLDRCLTVWHLLFYAIAHMAGAGVYVLTGAVVKSNAGPGAFVSYLICGVASLFTGLCYVEFATLVPKAGSCYTYTYLMLGELPAFVVGWTMLSDYIIGMASVAKAFSGTVDALCNHTVSGFFKQHMGTFHHGPSQIFDDTWDMVAVALILSLMLLVVAGANFSLSVNIGLSVLQLLCLATVAVAAFVYGSAANWTAGGGFFPYGISGVVQGATVAIFAYSGFESVSNAAEECRNPRRDLPIALLSSLGIIAVLYVAACLGISYLEPYYELDVNSPFVSAFSRRGAYWAEGFAAAGTLLATGATKLATMYVIPRMAYALASDGVILKCFANVNERVRVPLPGLFCGTALAAVLAMFFKLEFLADMVSMGILLSYFAVGLDLFVLRYLHFASGDKSKVPLRDWASGRLSSSLPWLGTLPGLKRLLGGFVVACFLCGGAVDYAVPQLTWWSWLLGCITLAAVLVTGGLLCGYQPHEVAEMYESPLMPLSPLTTIFINAVMIVKMQFYTWLRFLLWIGVGLILYFSYGIRHSTALEGGDAGAGAGGEYVSLDDTKPEKNNDNNDGKDGANLNEEKRPVLSGSS